ncbi:MAG: DUF6786 family protein [Proteiniphilum sp.]|jgi:hypothetical protein|nr:hypothetical protein [Porphyromonadaceae bacterium]MDD2314071.1 hypothetical protein [Proteiniphilum sp.]NCB24143.1 hypothetical protein [Bacteroidia bacterium]MDD2936822.1 hypothetical protein [Proteiniphilum sp.]MDD3075415.1 hypothetical protein [Proteiniphilum sp.]
MKIKKFNLFLLTAGFVLVSCTGNTKKPLESMEKEYEKGTFGYDLNYLSEKDSLIVLKSDDEKAQVILSAKYQAKVFTSTANGPEGRSHGFVNYNFFESGVVDEHMNGFGGENRLWLGPEGGRYSIFFEPGKEQVYDNWHTPKGIDIEAWGVSEATTKRATFTKELTLQNYLGNNLHIAAERTVSLVTESEIATSLGIIIPNNVHAVAYATENRITNQNDYEWTRETGTVCIWMLDMFIPSDSAVTVIPYHSGEESSLGRVVTSDYFGEIPADRLINENGVLYFKTDGKARGKLGMNAKRTTTLAGNYDPISKRLTIVTFDVDPEATYLNQEWNPEKDPLTGDALNAYNDGPLEDGSIMGPFLELESSSLAAFLKPGESLSHKHNVYHFVGDETDLSPISEKLFGVNLEKVKNIFN